MLAETNRIETCPICACIVSDSQDLPVQKVVFRKVKTPKLGPIMFLCSACCPDRDALDRYSRLYAIAHKEGEETERRAVQSFLKRYLPPREQPLSEMRF